MPLFFLMFDDDASHPVDEAARLKHREYFLGRSDKVVVGGPLFDEAQDVAGRVLIGEFDSLEAAKAWASQEPLVVSGRSRLVRASAITIVQKDGAFTPVAR